MGEMSSGWVMVGRNLSMGLPVLLVTIGLGLWLYLTPQPQLVTELRPFETTNVAVEWMEF